MTPRTVRRLPPPLSLGARGADRSTNDPLRVLVIDDSAVVRQAVLGLLRRERNVVAESAADPLFALEKMRRWRPHVILLDLEMPRMDGLTFLRQLMADDPIPVVVCSGLAAAGTDAALRALAEGAVEVIAKPELGVRDFLEARSTRLVETLRAAAGARVHRRRPPRAAQQTAGPPERVPALDRTTDRVVALGASTGGVEALRYILTTLPADAPGMVIVQHMPPGFTSALARQLNEVSALEVREARSGDRVRPGLALVAPGGHHMVLRRSGARYVVELDDGPMVRRHRPSVDVLLHSVAHAAGANAVGVLLTGMGDDGAAGLLAMRHAGAFTIAQDEATSVVFGMPREAIELGAAASVLPLDRIAGAIVTHARGRRLDGTSR